MLLFAKQIRATIECLDMTDLVFRQGIVRLRQLKQQILSHISEAAFARVPAFVAIHILGELIGILSPE